MKERITPDVNHPIGKEVYGFICQEFFSDYLEIVSSSCHISLIDCEVIFCIDVVKYFEYLINTSSISPRIIHFDRLNKISSLSLPS